jgi:hypothetical protein
MHSEPRSSVQCDYGLDDRGSITERGRGFSCRLCLQTGWWSLSLLYIWHRASCRRGWSMTLTIHRLLVPRLRSSRSHTSSPPKRHP